VLFEVLSDQSSDDGGNLPLLTSRKLGRFLEDTTHLADRTGSALLHVSIPNQIVKRNTKRITQLLNLVRP